MTLCYGMTLCHGMTLCYGMTLYCWQHPHMIAAGLHDGNVVVFNLQRDYSREAAWAHCTHTCS